MTKEEETGPFGGLSMRARNILHRYRIRNPNELNQLSDREIQSMRGVGPTIFAELRAVPPDDSDGFPPREIICPTCGGRGLVLAATVNDQQDEVT